MISFLSLVYLQTQMIHLQILIQHLLSIPEFTRLCPFIFFNPETCAKFRLSPEEEGGKDERTRWAVHYRISPQRDDFIDQHQITDNHATGYRHFHGIGVLCAAFDYLVMDFPHAFLAPTLICHL